jgi:hypothetical protein
MKELDRVMVQQNLQELQKAANIQREKKELERTRLREMMRENEEYQLRLKE